MKNRFVRGHNSIVNNSMKGKHHTVEVRRKLNESNKGELNSNYGKHPTVETRRKMSEAHKGKHHTIEARRKIGESHKRENDRMKGKHHSMETKKKMSEARKNFIKEHPNEAQETGKKAGLAALASLRKNSPYYLDNVPFASGEERQAMIIICEKFDIVPIEGKNCHVRMNGKEIDFRPFDNLFVEYHPRDWDDLTPNQYYEQRKKLLDENGFQNCKLIVTESLDELRKVLGVL